MKWRATFAFMRMAEKELSILSGNYKKQIGEPGEFKLSCVKDNNSLDLVDGSIVRIYYNDDLQFAGPITNHIINDIANEVTVEGTDLFGQISKIKIDWQSADFAGYNWDGNDDANDPYGPDLSSMEATEVVKRLLKTYTGDRYTDINQAAPANISWYNLDKMRPTSLTQEWAFSKKDLGAAIRAVADASYETLEGKYGFATWIEPDYSFRFEPRGFGGSYRGPAGRPITSPFTIKMRSTYTGVAAVSQVRGHPYPAEPDDITEDSVDTDWVEDGTNTWTLHKDYNYAGQAINRGTQCGMIGGATTSDDFSISLNGSQQKCNIIYHAIDEDWSFTPSGGTKIAIWEEISIWWKMEDLAITGDNEYPYIQLYISTGQSGVPQDTVGGITPTFTNANYWKSDLQLIKSGTSWQVLKVRRTAMTEVGTPDPADISDIVIAFVAGNSDTSAGATTGKFYFDGLSISKKYPSVTIKDPAALALSGGVEKTYPLNLGECYTFELAEAIATRLLDQLKAPIVSCTVTYPSFVPVQLNQTMEHQAAGINWSLEVTTIGVDFSGEGVKTTLDLGRPERFLMSKIRETDDEVLKLTEVPTGDDKYRDLRYEAACYKMCEQACQLACLSDVSTLETTEKSGKTCQNAYQLSSCQTAAEQYPCQQSCMTWKQLSVLAKKKKGDLTSYEEQRLSFVGGKPK
jgi:hypothetical protein